MLFDLTPMEAEVVMKAREGAPRFRRPSEVLGIDEPPPPGQRLPLAGALEMPSFEGLSAGACKQAESAHVRISTSMPHDEACRHVSEATALLSAGQFCYPTERVRAHLAAALELLK